MAALAPKASIATISGTFLAPGVSLNGRLYTVDNIRDAVSRMNAQIADGSSPTVSQYDSHYEDSVLHTVGKVIAAQQMPDGSARFTASVPDTSAGRDLATLTSTDYLRNVSIAAYWVGDMEEKEIDGEWITTAPGLDVRRIDYVADPGVPAARIDSVVLSEAAPGTWREQFATAEAAVVQPLKPKREGFRPAYADPGFREDGRPRLPLSSAREIADAWNELAEAGPYAPADLARARARVRAAAAAEGVELAEARRGNRSGMEKVIAVTQPSTPATCTEDLSQLVALDPDQDGDIDGWACPTCGSVRPNTDSTTNPDGDGLNLQSRTGDAVTETATTDKPADEAKPVLAEGRTLSDADVEAIAAKLTPKPSEEETKPAATEAAPTTPETPDLAELAESIKADIRQELVAAHLIPSRRGLVRPVAGEDGLKPRHLMTNEEWKEQRRLVADWVVPTGESTPTE